MCVCGLSDMCVYVILLVYVDGVIASRHVCIGVVSEDDGVGMEICV